MRQFLPSLLFLLFWLVIFDHARAETLSGFKDSYREKQSSSDSSTPSGDDETEDDTDDELEGWAWELLAELLVGDSPGRSFSYGRSPYEGRRSHDDGGWDAGWEAGAYDSTQGHHAELLLRADLIQTIFADSGGWDLEARIATTFAPALSIEHRYLMSWGNDEDMGLGQIVIAPRLWLADTWTLSWFFGASYLHDANGPMGLGPQIGARLELFVWDPFFLDLSTRVHGLGDVVMPEHRISFGAFLGHAWAAELRVDHLSIMGGASLTTVGLGARMQMGL